MTKNKQKDYKIDTKEKICNTVRRWRKEEEWWRIRREATWTTPQGHLHL